MILLKFGTFDEIEYFKERNIVSDIDNFPLLSPHNAFLSFFEQVDSEVFEIKVFNAKGFLAATVKSTQIKHKIILKDGKKYVMYCGDKLPCLDIPCDLYYLQIEDRFSQVFFANELDGYDKIKVSSNYTFSNIPYSVGFFQTYYFHHNFTPPVVKKYHKIEKNKKDENNLLYSRYYHSFSSSLYEQPSNIQEFFSHLDNCSIELSSMGKLYLIKAGNSNVEIEREEGKIGYFNINLEFSSTIEEINHCSDDTFKVLKEVPVLDDSCITINPIKEIVVDCDDFTPSQSDIIFFITITDVEDEWLQ